MANSNEVSRPCRGWRSRTTSPAWHFLYGMRTVSLQGIRFCARRTENGRNGDGRRGVRESGGSEGRKENEARWRRCSAREISWGRMWSRRDSCVQALFATMKIQSALPSIFSAADLSRAVLSVASVGVEDEDGTVFAGDLDRLAGVGALVEQVETRIIRGCTLLRRAQ